MTRKPRILFVGTVPPPYHGQAVAFQAAYEKMDGQKYLVNQNFETRPVWVKTLLLLGSFLKIWYFLVFKKIDIVYFTCSRSMFGSLKDIFLVFSAKAFRLPVVNHLHGAAMREFIDGLPRLYGSIVRRMYGLIDVSIVLLESMRKEFLQFWPDMEVRVVSNFYSEAFDAIEYKEKHNSVSIVYLSNIIYSKGILDLLDAFTELSSRHTDIELVIAGDFLGDGFYGRSEIEQAFKSKLQGLERASFVGVVSGDRKVELLARSDIFVLPTFYPMEAFPLAIIEAMRAGNAIVTTLHNYLPEIVDDSMGVLVPSRSPTDLADAVESMLDNPERLAVVQRHNMDYAKKHYGTKSYIQKLDAIIKDVLHA